MYYTIKISAPLGETAYWGAFHHNSEAQAVLQFMNKLGRIPRTIFARVSPAENGIIPYGLHPDYLVPLGPYYRTAPQEDQMNYQHQNGRVITTADAQEADLARQARRERRKPGLLSWLARKIGL